MQSEAGAAGAVHSALQAGALTTTFTASQGDHLRLVEQELCAWMESYEYTSVRQMQGSMSQQYCPDPSAFERAQQRRALQS